MLRNGVRNAAAFLTLPAKSSRVAFAAAVMFVQLLRPAEMLPTTPRDAALLMQRGDCGHPKTEYGAATCSAHLSNGSSSSSSNLGTATMHRSIGSTNRSRRSSARVAVDSSHAPKSSRELALETRLRKAELQIARLVAAAAALHAGGGKMSADEDREQDEIANAVAPPHSTDDHETAWPKDRVEQDGAGVVDDNRDSQDGGGGVTGRVADSAGNGGTPPTEATPKRGSLAARKMTKLDKKLRKKSKLAAMLPPTAKPADTTAAGAQHVGGGEVPRDPWHGRTLNPKVDFHPDLQISPESLATLTEADSPAYLKGWCATMAAQQETSSPLQWYPGCKPAPDDFWLWKADLNDKSTRVIKAFRGSRPGKMWKVSFPNVHGSGGQHEHSYLKLAASSWITHGGNSDSWAPQTSDGPAHRFKSCREGQGAGTGINPETGKPRPHFKTTPWATDMSSKKMKRSLTRTKRSAENDAEDAALQQEGPAETVSGVTHKRLDDEEEEEEEENQGTPSGHEGFTGRMIPNNWNAGLPGAVLSEMLVYSIDTMLGMSTVPPGRFFALDADAIADKWAKDHLCADKDAWEDYVKQLPGEGKDARIFAWLQTVAPDVGKNSERGLPHCFSLCNKAGIAAMLALGPLLDCEKMGEVEIDATIANHKAGNTPIDGAKETLFESAKSCCKAARSPSKMLVALVQSLTSPCDKKANCFSAKFGGEYHSITLDNDCLRTPKRHSSHEAPTNSCAAYPKGLRQHYIVRYNAIMVAFPNTESPFAAAAMATMAAQIRSNYGPEVVELVFRFMYHPASAGATGFWPQNFWVSERNQKEQSHADRTARRLYDSFVGCEQDGY